jgi:hypothetical protein
MRGGNGVARTGQKCDVGPRRHAVRDDDLPGQRAEQPRRSRSDRGRAEGHEPGSLIRLVLTVGFFLFAICLLWSFTQPLDDYLAKRFAWHYEGAAVAIHHTLALLRVNVMAVINPLAWFAMATVGFMALDVLSAWPAFDLLRPFSMDMAVGLVSRSRRPDRRPVPARAAAVPGMESPPSAARADGDDAVHAPDIGRCRGGAAPGG